MQETLLSIPAPTELRPVAAIPGQANNPAQARAALERLALLNLRHSFICRYGTPWAEKQ